ncbi:hypothetical protein K7432_002140 [Basidiobolus ranarum]|uniref:Zn(2)-C6 fungal-type domain-containing protein n=1 Tax=Basidiobolus ranarum TaxID=34480 RepID=A0ABR2W8P7_9FUNG
MNISTTEHDSSTYKKPRATRACDLCRKKKVKCDSVKPSCANCTMFGYDCTYLDKPKKRGPQAANPKTLEARLKRIEFALTGLLDTDSISTSSSVMQEVTSIGNGEKASSDWSEEHLSKEGSDSDEDEELEEEFSQLAIEQRARYKYLGSSSGMYLLEGGKYHVNGVLTKFCELALRPELQTLGPDFPTQEIENQLLEVYFSRSHNYFPIFNKAGFLQRLNSGKGVSNVLLNSICAVGCILEGLTVFKDPGISRSATRFFFNRAKTELDKQYHISSLYTVQGLLLMAFNPAGGWLFLGMAVRMAQDLGLHRNIESDSLDPIEKQNRKLAWWGCVIFDRLHSAMGGKPLAINEDDFDTTLPMDYGLKDKGDVSPGSSTSLRYLTQTVRLTMLISKIIRGIYIPRSGAKNKSSTNLWSLNKSLSDWETSLSPEFRIQYDNPPNTSTFACLINSFYQYSLILLNRPFIPRFNDDHEAKASNNPAQLICERAASRITWISYYTPLEWQLHGISVKPGLLFSSSTIHLINSMSNDKELARVAKNNFAVNLKIMRQVSAIFFGAHHILTILEDLAKTRGLDNLNSLEPILYDPPKAALSPDVSHKLPRRTDSGSVVVLPNPPSDNLDCLSEGSDPRASYESTTPSPLRSTTSSTNPTISNNFHWTPIETPVYSQQPEIYKDQQQLDIAEPIYQCQNTSYTAPLNLFENNISLSSTLNPVISNIPQFAATSGYPTFTPNGTDFELLCAQRPDSDAPLLNLMQMEMDFDDWNNYFNQFGQSHSNPS